MNKEWTQESIDEICSGFQKARILLTAAEIDIFSILSQGPKTVEQICESGQLSLRGVRILLDALVSMGLLLKDSDNNYAVESKVCDLLCKDASNAFLPMVLHRARMWKTWSNLTEIVRTGSSDSFVDRKRRTKEELEAFIGAMHAIGSEKAAEIAQKIDLKPYSRMIDVGGASGSYIVSFLRENDNLRATLFDLPEVIPMARQRMSDEGLIERVEFVEGNYHHDTFPLGHDLALLSAVIHINSREDNRKIFKKLYDCMVSGGAILIRDFFMDDSRTAPPLGAIFAVNMLVATSSGNSYTLNEVFEDLIESGFVNPALLLDGPRMDQVIMGARP